MFRVAILSACLLSLFSISSVFAMPVKFGCGTHECSKCHTLSMKEASEILKPLNVTVHSIKQAPIQGMFEVLAKRSDQEGVVYIDFAKKKIMQGVIVNVPTMEAVAAHAKEPPQLQKVRMLDHTQLPLQHALVMGTPNASKKLVVFTDPDCPYCRVLHAELIKLEKSKVDVAIYILLYPLPSHPQAYDTSRVLVASKDKTLLNSAFEGKNISKPVGDQGKAEIEAVARFAHSHGISGTPTMVLPNGSVITGVRDFESLKKLLAVQ